MKRYQTDHRGYTDGLKGEAYTPETKEDGGKRKGRSMKRKPRTYRYPTVTLENLQNGRAHNGYYDAELKCVVYTVKPNA